MQTTVHKRYFDILRREDKKRHVAAGCDPVEVSKELIRPSTTPGISATATVVGPSSSAAYTTHPARGRSAEPPGKDGKQRRPLRPCPPADSTASAVHNDGGDVGGSGDDWAAWRAASAEQPPPLTWDPFVAHHLPSTAITVVQELTCCSRGITALHPNLLRFEQLRTLVLERNALVHIRNLVPWLDRQQQLVSTMGQGCRLLQRLFLAHNRVADIAATTDIPHLRSLVHLSLAYNRLVNLEAVLAALQPLHSLSFLDMRKNPIAGEPLYRLRCIAALPQVQILDCMIVTNEERQRAAAMDNEGDSSEEVGSLQIVADQLSQKPGPRSTSGGVWCHHNRTGERAGGPSTGFYLAQSTGYHGRTAPSSRFASAKENWKTAKSGKRRHLQRSHATMALEARCAEYWSTLEATKAAEEAAKFATEKERDDIHVAFNAVWVLSRAGMPLSDLRFQQWAVAPDGSSEEATNAAAARNTPSPLGGIQAATAAPPRRGRTSIVGGRAKPRDNQPALQLPQLMSRKSSNTVVPVPLESLSLGASGSRRHDGDRIAYDGAYFDIILGDEATAKAKRTQELTGPSQEGPASSRLASLQTALHASVALVQPITIALDNDEASSPTVEEEALHRQQHQSRKPPTASSTPVAKVLSRPASAATAPKSPMVELDMVTLREVQLHKGALIPPPWEGRETEKDPIGRSGAAVVTQETIAALFSVMQATFSQLELQAIQAAYGDVDLLQLSPTEVAQIPDAGAPPQHRSGSNSSGTRRIPSNVSERRRAAKNSVGSSLPLPEAMMSVAQRNGSSGFLQLLTSAFVDTDDELPAAVADDAPSPAAQLLRPIGPYTPYTLRHLLGLLNSASASNKTAAQANIDMEQFFTAVTRFHQVEKRQQRGDGVTERQPSGGVVLLPPSAVLAADGKSAKGKLGNSLSGASQGAAPVNGQRRSKMASHVGGRGRNSDVSPPVSARDSTTGKGSSFSNFDAASPRRKKSLVAAQLTVMSTLVALTLYLPFMERRTAQLEEELRCLAVKATVSSRKEAAPEEEALNAPTTIFSATAVELQKLFHRASLLRSHTTLLRAALGKAPDDCIIDPRQLFENAKLERHLKSQQAGI